MSAFATLLRAERDRLQRALTAIDALLEIYQDTPNNDLVREVQAEQAKPPLPQNAPVTSPRPAAGSWISPERDALALRLYNDGVATKVIFEQVIALPGPIPSSIATVMTRINSLGGRRPSQPAPDPPQTKNEVMARIGALPAPASARPPITTDLNTIIAKAATWGIQARTWDDLPRINEHASRIGHPQFVRPA